MRWTVLPSLVADGSLTKADRIAQSAANLDKMVEAAKPCTRALTTTQKHEFITFGRMLVPERGRFAKEN